MKKLFALISVIATFLFLLTTAFSQDRPQDRPLIPPPPVTERNGIENPQTEVEKYVDNIGKPRDPLNDDREPRVLKKGLLAPAEADGVLYAGVLKQPNTGLIRLMPREIYDSEVYHTKKQSNIRGGGAYYSFSRLTHVYGYGSDISLEQGHLSVGFAGADYGMLTDLGMVALDNVSLDHPFTNFLASYKPPPLETDARNEYRRFSAPNGVPIDGITYYRRVPVQEGDTYLLRSISFDRSDVLVAFQIVRKDSDGSVILAWKILKSFAPTKLQSRID